MDKTMEAKAKHALHTLETHLKLSICHHPETREDHLSKANCALQLVRTYRHDMPPARRHKLSDLIQEAGAAEIARQFPPSYSPLALLAFLDVVPPTDKLACVKTMASSIEMTPNAWRAYEEVFLNPTAEKVTFVAGLYRYFEFMTPGPKGITLASFLTKDNPTGKNLDPFHALAMSHSRSLPPPKAAILQRILLGMS